MKNFSDLFYILDENKFDLYLSTQSLEHEDAAIMHDIYTCNSGEYKGEIVDIFYNFDTDQVIKIEYSNQFKKPCKFKL